MSKDKYSIGFMVTDLDKNQAKNFNDKFRKKVKQYSDGNYSSYVGPRSGFNNKTLTYSKDN